MSMEEANFPRGGRKSFKKEEESSKKHRKAKQSKKRSSDFLFGNAPSEESGKKSKRSKKTKLPATASSKKSLLPLGGGAVVQPQKGEAYIEALSFSKLAKGFRLLAYVREVHEDLAIFSLPNQWTGYMLRSDHDPPCDKALSIGQLLSVQIVKAVQESTKGGPRRRIQVTCNPATMNPRDASVTTAGLFVRGQVVSVEDHGILVDLGHKRRGFLPFDEIEGEYTVDEDGSGVPLNEGRISDFLVRSSGADANIVPLALPFRERRARQFLPATHTPTLHNLQPGTLVHATVESVIRNGLCVTFAGGVYRGAIESQHLGSHWIPDHRQESDEWKKIFEENRSLTARIIAVDAATKIVRLSLLPHLLELGRPPALPAVGTVLEKSTVLRLDPGVGALLALPDLMDSDESKKPLHQPVSTDNAYSAASRVQAVYVHISKAMDEQEDGKTSDIAFAKHFAPSTHHSVRILSTSNWIEGIASGATANSVIQAHVLTHADLVPGKEYKQVPVCAQLDGGGILVDFGMGVRGMIPPMQLFDQAVTSDYRTKMRKVKYAIGAKVDVRVLSVDIDSKKCMLTAKKSLLKTENIISSFEDVEVGKRGTGFVSKVDDRGLSVTFFNGVYGRVTSRSLAAELGVENHKDNYHIGDVVECRVVNKKQKKGSGLEAEDDEMDVDNEKPPRRAYWELTLSLGVQSEDAMEEEDITADRQVSSKTIQLRAGAVLPLRSLRIVELVKGKQKEKGFVPGYAIVSVKSKYVVAEEDSANMVSYVECKLPYDQLLDSYKANDIESAAALDALAEKLLTVGKKVNRKGLVLVDPKKSKSEYYSGTGKLTVVSIRPKLFELAEAQFDNEAPSPDLILPRPDTQLYMGAKVQGYVAQIDPRHGAFIRFLDGLTGLVPKLKGGLDLPLYGTVVTRVIALDVTTRPMKILLAKDMRRTIKREEDDEEAVHFPVKVGDYVKEAEIEKVDFHRATVNIIDESYAGHKIKARIHCSMAGSKVSECPKRYKGDGKQEITKFHPFHGWKAGTKLPDLVVVAVASRVGTTYLELSNRIPNTGDEDAKTPLQSFFVESSSQLVPGMKVSGIVSSVSERKTGLYLLVSPGLSGFVPALELSKDPDILNDLQRYFPPGSRLECVVMDKTATEKTRFKYYDSVSSGKKVRGARADTPFFSFLNCKDGTENSSKPIRGDLIVGRINGLLPTMLAPAVMLDLRGGFVGRCCITELDEPDNWVNMPLGRTKAEKAEDLDAMTMESGEEEQKQEETSDENGEQGEFHHGKYVACRVLAGIPGKPLVDVSLRDSRMEGDLDNDVAPEVGETIQAYVVKTTKKGCFLRVSRQVEGRTILKELSDSFLPDPAASFPTGRLIAGKVKALHDASKKAPSICKMTVDLDMRESSLLDTSEKLKFEDIEVGSKHRGTVSRIEAYGVFVRLENSHVSGLCHKSECSDNYIKDLSGLYDPGDLVKVLVLKKDDEKKQVGFSMKARHFENDQDSDDDESFRDDDSTMNDAASDGVNRREEANDLDSEDEEFASKFAAKINKEGSDGSDSEEMQVGRMAGKVESESDDSSEDDGDDSSDEEDGEAATQVLDTDVGFSWEGATSRSSFKKDAELHDEDNDESSSEEEDDEDAVQKLSHKSRRKQAQRRREEQDIARRETALADGTADENPETAADFERILAGNPNSSEVWIRYMAFHLTLADIPAAREVAERAFQRIEFRQEREKLNVWCALLALEMKYGSTTSLQDTMDRACQHNNPKQVYLRVCEMLEKEAVNASPDSLKRADEMFGKMCKKFKNKKKVWIAHLEYLLKSGRHEEAYALSKRALQSLPAHKHVETISKFAQLVFENGSAEKARTLFDGLLVKYPKRLDLFFVYADKEVKHGEIEAARSLFERAASPDDKTMKMKLSDKQMKSLFKKWYSMEEQHGTDETRDRVKDAARAYVERSTN